MSVPRNRASASRFLASPLRQGERTKVRGFRAHPLVQLPSRQTLTLPLSLQGRGDPCAAAYPTPQRRELTIDQQTLPGVDPAFLRVQFGCENGTAAIPGGVRGVAVAADQTLLPLHLSFCRTTLKNEASGNEASGSVFLAFRIVTVDPRSTWIGLRPSSVR